MTIDFDNFDMKEDISPYIDVRNSIGHGKIYGNLPWLEGFEEDEEGALVLNLSESDRASDESRYFDCVRSLLSPAVQRTADGDQVMISESLIFVVAATIST